MKSFFLTLSMVLFAASVFAANDTENANNLVSMQVYDSGTHNYWTNEKNGQVQFSVAWSFIEATFSIGENDCKVADAQAPQRGVLRQDKVETYGFSCSIDANAIASQLVSQGYKVTGTDSYGDIFMPTVMGPSAEFFSGDFKTSKLGALNLELIIPAADLTPDQALVRVRDAIRASKLTLKLYLHKIECSGGGVDLSSFKACAEAASADRSGLTRAYRNPQLERDLERMSGGRGD